MHIIENEFLKVSVNEEGAELYSIYDKEMEKETLWYGDEKFWARRSPILFPNVGRNFENYCIYNGERFDTELHGFARSSLFQCIDEKEDCISFQLSDTEATRAYFPFAFQLKISYLTELHGFARSSLFQCIDEKEDCISFQLSDTEATRAYFPFAFQLKISYLLEGRNFARSSLFQCIDEKEDCISFQLSDTEATRAYFPFAFQLKISYLLEGRNLKVLWEVTNQDDKTMYFTIGGHPGFNVPILENTKQTDYKLIFKQPELEYILVHEGGSGTADPTKPYQLSLKPVGEYYGCPVTEHMFDNDALIFDNSQVQWVGIAYPDGTPYITMDCSGFTGEYYGCPVTEHMFDNDALIFDNSQVQWVGIAYPDGTPYITMDCSGFTNFGIWSLPGAPYICLEPWMGRCDNYGFHDEISEKPDIVSLEAKNTFKTSYTIGVHKK